MANVLIQPLYQCSPEDPDNEGQFLSPVDANSDPVETTEASAERLIGLGAAVKVDKGHKAKPKAAADSTDD